MENFAPLTGLIGGVLIGISISILLFFNGRITGINGIMSALLSPEDGEWLWRFIYLCSMIVGVIAYSQIATVTFAPNSSYPKSLLVIGGILVGFGTRLGNGCTSGHGICGVSRLSPRSIVATIVFMSTGAITVSVIRHVANLTS